MRHVAIDLTSLPRLKGGVAFYLVELIAALQRNPRDLRVSLIVRRELAGEIAIVSERFSVVPVDLRSRPIRLAWEQTGLPALVRRIGADVLHSPHYTRPIARLACASVVGIMDMTFFLLPEHHTIVKRVFFRSMIRASARLADRFIAISESTSRDLQAGLGVPPDRIDVTPLAVSPDYRPVTDAARLADVRRKYDLPAEFVLYVGRLEPRKNLPRLLDAYHMLTEESAGTPRLVLGGARGWQTSELDRRLHELGGRVQLLGYVEEEDLPALYSQATLFVYPSLYEGFGIPVLEALSCGAPTLTSDVSSMPEVAGGAAALVNPADTQALKSALARLLGSPSERAALRARGLQRAAAFSWDRTAHLTAESYARTHDQWLRTAQ